MPISPGHYAAHRQSAAALWWPLEPTPRTAVTVLRPQRPPPTAQRTLAQLLSILRTEWKHSMESLLSHIDQNHMLQAILWRSLFSYRPYHLPNVQNRR